MKPGRTVAANLGPESDPMLLRASCVGWTVWWRVGVNDSAHKKPQGCGLMNVQEGWLANKRMHLTVGRPAVTNSGSCRRPPAGDAQRCPDSWEDTTR